MVAGILFGWDRALYSIMTYFITYKIIDIHKYSMNKSKLFGTKLIENVKVPKIPSVIILNKYEGLSNIDFEEGDLLDANSIKMYIKYLSGLDNVVTFNNIASKQRPGIVQCGDNLNIHNGIINVESISKQFIEDL